MKKCNDCGEVKPLSEFHKKAASKDGYQAKCKVCNKAKVQKWQAENPEAYESIWRKNIGKEGALKRRARTYGISVEELVSLLENSGGLCDICKRPPVTKPLVVDHCHKGGNVRGILCHNCNTALGLFADNIEWMQKAIEYLQK